MPMTYIYKAALALLLALPPYVLAQSLEERALQERRRQVETMTGRDVPRIDSLFNERADRRDREMVPGRQPAGTYTSREEPDSMLSGPVAPYEGWEEDSLLQERTQPKIRKRGLQDSSDTSDSRRMVRNVPRRYEQRIFRAVDPSTFSSARGSTGRDYVLGPGDRISASLWGDREKEYSLMLNVEGKVFLEGVGLVALGGLTLEEAEKRLKERMGRIHSGVGRGTTHLDVSLEAAGPIKVFVLGEVKVPGGYVFTGNTSVLSALYFARGPSNIGSVRSLQLTRGGKKFTLDLYQYLMKGEIPAPAALQDGDILFAPRAEILAEVDGDVGRTAVFELKPGEGVKELLEFGGRPNATAAQQRMSLQRIMPGGQVHQLDLEPPADYLSGKAKMAIQDGDRLMVQRSSEPNANFVAVTGPVKYPGRYAADGVRNVRDLVVKAGGLREDAFLGRVHVVRFRPNGSSSMWAYALDTTLVDSIGLESRDSVILYSVKDMYIPDSVEISGAVFLPGRYEYRQGMTAKDLAMLAGGFLPTHQSGSLLVFRGDPRADKVEQIPLTIGLGLGKGGDAFVLKPRDFIHVPVDPRWYKKEIVTLEGLFLHPGKYALLHPGEKLSSVIQRAGGLKPNAYVEGGRFFRSKDSVGRFGVDIRYALGSPRSKSNIPLLDGDSIYIPGKQNSIKVLGEVGFETSVLYKEGATVEYYVNKAGGYTRRSERDRVVVQYANGEISRDGYFNRKPDGGSVIFVPQGPEPKSVDWFTGINALLGTMGVVVALILSIQAIRD